VTSAMSVLEAVIWFSKCAW